MVVWGRVGWKFMPGIGYLYAKVLAIQLQKLQTGISSEASATTNWHLFRGWPSTALLLLFHWTKWRWLLNSTHHYCSYQGPGLSVRWTDLQLHLFLLISSPSSARGRCSESVWLLAYLAGACSASPVPPWFAPCRTESSPVNRKPNTHKVIVQVLYVIVAIVLASLLYTWCILNIKFKKCSWLYLQLQNASKSRVESTGTLQWVWMRFVF